MLRLALVASLLSGCSLALQSKPRGSAKSDCSTSHVYWVADAVGVAAGLAAMIYAATAYDGEEAALGGPAALGAVFYAASAGNGYRWRRECSRPASSIAVR